MPEKIKAFEKKPLSSKKFIAFLVSGVLWKVICIILIVFFGGSPGLLGNLFTIILVSGFVDVTYIGGQAALDHYVRTAEILAGKKKKPLPKQE